MFPDLFDGEFVADLIGYNYNQFLLISFLNELMQTLNGNDFTWSGWNAIHSIWLLWSILFNLLRATVCAWGKYTLIAKSESHICMCTVLLEYHQGKLIYEINILYVNKSCIYSDYKWMNKNRSSSFLNILNWLIHTLVYEYKENIWMWW